VLLFLIPENGDRAQAVIALKQHSLMVTLTAALTVMAAPHGAMWAAEPVTFNKDVAPIVFEQCTICHRPGGAGPFALLTYEDVKARARQIVAVTERRYMPPWKPEPGYGEFAATRRLSDEQVAVIRQWVEEGMLRGDPGALSPLPAWSGTWRYGEPDLVVSMPQPYTLRPDGPDMFRTFVLPVPTSVGRYVKAWEFRPGNSRVVHHATIQIDATDASRRLDEQDPDPGYEGLVPHSARPPDGYFLDWAPGHTPYLAGEGMAWPLAQASDLVMMVHLRPSGRVEQVQVSIGLYFSDTPPTRIPAMVRLTRQSLDIPPGEQAYRVGDSYTLPVDVDAYAVQPHAHYLAREAKVRARLPDGTTRWLLLIKDWDFDWQDVYRFATPVFLPAGSTVAAEWTYDNSAENPRNPHNPPKRVTYGQQTSNEMSELWLQVLPRKSADRPALTEGVRAKVLPEEIVGFELMLKADPENVGLHDDVALLYAEAGKLDQTAAHFRESLRLRPESAAAHYNVGAALMELRRLDEAGGYFRKALELNPDYTRAHQDLAAVLESTGRLEDAAEQYAAAGQFERAVAAAERVLERARAARDEATAARILKRLERYRQRRR